MDKQNRDRQRQRQRKTDRDKHRRRKTVTLQKTSILRHNKTIQKPFVQTTSTFINQQRPTYLPVSTTISGFPLIRETMQRIFRLLAVPRGHSAVQTNCPVRQLNSFRNANCALVHKSAPVSN